MSLKMKWSIKLSTFFTTEIICEAVSTQTLTEYQYWTSDTWCTLKTKFLSFLKVKVKIQFYVWFTGFSILILCRPTTCIWLDHIDNKSSFWFEFKANLNSYRPPLTQRLMLGPLNILCTMVRSEMMSTVGTHSQKIRIITQVLRSKLAILMFAFYILTGFSIKVIMPFILKTMRPTPFVKYPYDNKFNESWNCSKGCSKAFYLQNLSESHSPKSKRKSVDQLGFNF